jgi:hypothetical protein
MATNFQNLLLLFGPTAAFGRMGAGTIRTGGTTTLAGFLGGGANLLGLRVVDGAAVTFHGNVKAITDRQNILILQVQFLRQFVNSDFAVHPVLPTLVKKISS